MEREQTTIRLPDELMKKLQADAEKKGIPFNAYVLKVFDDYVNRQK